VINLGSKVYRYLHAKTLLKQNRVTLLRSRIDPVNPFFLFLVNQTVRVSYNYKGWLSDWTETNDEYEYRCRRAIHNGRDIPQRNSSVFLVGKDDDAYILACKLLLQQRGIPLDSEGNLNIQYLEDIQDG
jgi:hypothetical protein